jgi:hypothetical protein
VLSAGQPVGELVTIRLAADDSVGRAERLDSVDGTERPYRCVRGGVVAPPPDRDGPCTNDAVPAVGTFVSLSAQTINGFSKRITHTAFGLRSFVKWHIRVHLYTGKPDWPKLTSIARNPARFRSRFRLADGGSGRSPTRRADDRVSSVPLNMGVVAERLTRVGASRRAVRTTSARGSSRSHSSWLPSFGLGRLFGPQILLKRQEPQLTTLSGVGRHHVVIPVEP